MTRYGIKYGGVIRVSESQAKLVGVMLIAHGEYVERGEKVSGGWWRVVEPVDENTLTILETDYEVRDLDGEE